MTIVRIFRVRVDPKLKEEFERKFETVSVNAVTKRAGFLSETIHKPTKWTPDEYAMISRWESEEALRAFAGTNWNHAVIPKEMAKYVIECWVHHYELW